MRRMMNRGRKLVLAMTAGSVFVLSGCDPNVRDTVLTGVEASTTTLFGTFLNAFFESLATQDDSTTQTI
ncbi:MAG: hypothetical protein KDA32_14380 [Phycisphaerales bacterium]|nr:hypothetical protein [Phycisphaerales bacterium]